MNRRRRVAFGVCAALVMATCLWLGEATVHAASCGSISYGGSGPWLEHCGEYTYENEAVYDMWTQAESICQYYYWGAHASLYWYYREGDGGGPAYWSSGWMCS
jgi:hypothetical protein